MTEEVAAACLANNHGAVARGEPGRRGGRAALAAITRLMHALERGLIDRKLEALPGEEDLRERAAAGQGLTRPELAVVMSFTKIALTADLLASRCPDHPPRSSRCCGPASPPRCAPASPTTSTATGCAARSSPPSSPTPSSIGVGSPSSTASARRPARPCRDRAVLRRRRARVRTRHLWGEVSALDGRLAAGVSSPSTSAWHGSITAAAPGSRARAWAGRGLAETIAFHASVARELRDLLPTQLPPTRGARLASATAEAASAGVPEALARELALAEALADSCDIALVVEAAGMENLASAAKAYFDLTAHLGLAETLVRAKRSRFPIPTTCSR